MQTNSFSFKKRSWLLLGSVVVFSLMMLVQSCNQGEQKATEEMQLVDMDLSCMILTKDKIAKAWPTADQLKSIAYLTFFPDIDPTGTKDFALYVQAYRADNSSIGSLVALEKGTDCSIKLPYVGTGKNIIGISDLGIIENGALKEFDYVKLTPATINYDGSDYLNFDVSVYKGGAGTPIARGALPCPPCYNCRPIPPDCDVVPDTTYNSLKTVDSSISN